MSQTFGVPPYPLTGNETVQASAPQNRVTTAQIAALAGGSAVPLAITGSTIDNSVIGGTTPAAGTFTNANATGYLSGSVGNALTAIGTNKATSLALTKQTNNITSAGSGTGVTLPTVASVGIGGWVIIFSGGANAIQVYGGGSDTIDGAAAATGVPLTNTKRCIYYAVAAATWISAQLGVVSA